MKTLIVFLLCLVASGQTVINGSRTVLGTLDATGATATRPVKTGTSLPATCTVGDLYFKSDATAGQNLYECASTNTWTQQLAGNGAPDPLSTAYVWDDFYPGATSSGYLSALNWYTYGAGLSAAYVIQNATRPGVLRLSTDVSSNSTALITAGYTALGNNALPDLSNKAGLEMIWIFKMNSVDSNTTFRVGCYDTYDSTTTMLESSNMIEYTGTGNMTLKSCNASGTCNSADIGVAPNSTSWWKLRMYTSTAGTLYGQVSNNGAAYSSPVSVSINTSGLGCAPALFLKTGTTAARTADIDFYSHKYTITR